MSLDEFSQYQGHHGLLTMVMDLDQAQLIEVINSHKQKDVMTALEAFAPEARASVEEVSIDMWGGFTHVIEVLFPNAKIFYDRFHVMEHVNEELNQLRRQMHVKFKGLPHLLWKNREALSNKQWQQLDEGLKGFPCLRIVYEFKEELRQIYEHARTVQGAKRQFQRWIRIAGRFYQKSAQMIEQHWSGICNYFEHRTTSSVTEGINTKIKLIKRQRVFRFLCKPLDF
ncbi:transposase [Leptolyngbya sp. PL-A3]|uniref:transposase n=1 Tax=Leptolyngbya sp. PL-A3 TaxID=2933911 RepID=UPI00329A6FFB